MCISILFSIRAAAAKGYLVVLVVGDEGGLTLDASASYDPDFDGDSSSGLTFEWSCVDFFSE